MIKKYKYQFISSISMILILSFLYQNMLKSNNSKNLDNPIPTEMAQKKKDRKNQ